ncbi:hypothetical protein BH11MYX2_BH11MYX2_08560 [soil metagenome]
MICSGSRKNCEIDYSQTLHASRGPAQSMRTVSIVKGTSPGAVRERDVQMKRIFVALDGSDRAPTVLAVAVRLADLTDAKLVVFRACGLPPDMPKDLFEVTDLTLEQVLKRNAKESLAQLTRDIPPNRIEHVVTELATPWDGICRHAKLVDADLIVLGSHGYGKLDRLLGTTAAKVVNHADRNVFVVRSVL